MFGNTVAVGAVTGCVLRASEEHDSWSFFEFLLPFMTVFPYLMGYLATFISVSPVLRTVASLVILGLWLAFPSVH